jgi:1,4-dihydroxy-2-naphthoate octaprenyltransferase
LFGIAASLLAYLIIFILLLLLGGIIYAIFGWPGLITFIIVCTFLSLSRRSTKGKTRKRNLSKEERFKKWWEMDEKLEDYNYLDDMTGRDDKPWI